LKKEPSFEDALDRLEEIVQALEDGEAELDETLSLFEEGVKLSKLCHKRLETAEKKIELLVKKEGGKLGRREIADLEDDLNLSDETE
jgi:exodeoxyribonuclease VII small subunit